ncbi:MAG: hypothetical protein ABSA46_04740 [Thermodesulfovibrionales bacterium]
MDYLNTQFSRQLIHYLLEPVIKKPRQYFLPVFDAHNEMELNSIY